MNQIGDAGALAIGLALERNQVSYTFSFFSCIINFPYLLQTLTTLELFYNRIGDAGAQAIAQGLERNQVNCPFIFFTSITGLLY